MPDYVKRMILNNMSIEELVAGLATADKAGDKNLITAIISEYSFRHTGGGGNVQSVVRRYYRPVQQNCGPGSWCFLGMPKMYLMCGTGFRIYMITSIPFNE